MDLFIFRTNVETAIQIEVVEVLFNQYPMIVDWFVDTEDIDNVMRVEVSEMLTEIQIIDLIKSIGFDCELLPD